MLISQSISPIILSASRATDIPAFYGDWFLERLKEGYFIKRNPFNGQLIEIKTDKTELIVFWTKNPKPFLDKLSSITKFIPNYYFQYTLNNYNEFIEPGLPNIDERIDTFKRLSDKVGKESVIWRYDPLLMSSYLSVDLLIQQIKNIAEKINSFTSKLVISFIDIENYIKVKRKILKSESTIREFTENEKKEFAYKIRILKEKYDLDIFTCAEEIDLSEFGILKNKCIDDQLIENQFSENENLMHYIQQKQNIKDKGQRKECRCIRSTDIGQYNTCPHNCVYCYANSTDISGYSNYKKHLKNPIHPSII